MRQLRSALRVSAPFTRTGILLGGFAALWGPPASPISGQDGSVPTFRPAAEPLLSVGAREGDSPYELFKVVGAVRLSDGSVVAMVQGHHEVRRFGPDGGHLWSVGRAGEGPMEFSALPELLPTCTSADEVVIYDRLQYRVTVLNRDGGLVDEYLLRFGDRSPYSRIKCSPSRRMVFTRYADEELPTEPGPYRWVMDMAYTDGEGSEATILRAGIPGADRMAYFRNGLLLQTGPLTWGRTVYIAPVDEGVWIGTADDYEIELLDWTGSTTRRIRWEGPDRAVTAEHIKTYRDNLYRSYENSNRSDWRRRFNEVWETRRPALPSIFPAYNAIMVSGDRIWVKHFRRPGDPEHHWLAFDAEGNQVAAMFLPSRFVAEQIGADWVLVRVTDELGLERLAVYGLVGG